LPTRPTKREGNSHANAFVGDSVELDALPVGVPRDLMRMPIEQHIDADAPATLREAEESERELIKAWANGLANESRPPQ
jgi:hypothetical protein